MFDKKKTTADGGANEAASNESEEIAATNGGAKTKPAIKSKQEVATINEDGEFEAMFKHAKSSKGVEITAEYLDLSQLETETNYIFAFLGMTTFNGDNGTQPAVRLVDEDKTQYILASKVVVGACEKIETAPAMIGITVHGKKKSGAGSYYDCTVVRY